jgi:ribonuclease R
VAKPSNTRKSGQESPEETLLAYLGRPDYRPLPQRRLLHVMQVPGDRRPAVRAAIERLLAAGKLVKLRGGRLASAPRDGTVVGILQRQRDGYGFVIPDDGGRDLYVAPRHLEGLLSGDRVRARVTGRGRGDRLEGAISEVLERRPRRVLGVFRADGREGSVHPFDPSLAWPVRVPVSRRGGAADEEVVSVEILSGPGERKGPGGKVVERLGRMDSPGVDVCVISRRHRLREEFPEEVLRAADRLPSRVSARAKRERQRFDDPTPVTIDGETAQDFDDAVAVRALRGGGFRLWVHIADVAHFVPPGGALDEEARHRATSVYFPGRVLPMFPEKLSNDLCSLRPGVDRLVQTAILDLDGRGALKRVRFADGVIRSAARLTYAQVAEALEGGRPTRGLPARLLPMLRDADRLRRVLEQRREARGSVDCDLPEPTILLDVAGEMTGIRIEPRNRAHRMIEEFMLAANEAVAGHLEQRGAPCMYRVHDAPDRAKLEILDNIVSRFGLHCAFDAERIEPRHCQKLLRQAEGMSEAPLIHQIVLRSMKQARYSMENSGHFGLALERYTHFTSPIRRYPDLVVHRLLRQVRSRRRVDPEEAERLTRVAASCSKLERNAEAAERELLAWKKVAFIEDKVGRLFAGAVTGVAPFGLFVQIEENLVEGLIRVESLGRERFDYSEQRAELRGSRSKRRFRLGDRLQVRVARVDRILKRVDFTLSDA